MKLIVARMRHGWGENGKSWASYLEKEYLQRRKIKAGIADDNTYIASLAFVGLGSRRIPGNPPSEQVRERFWAVGKPTVSTAAKHHRSTVSFLIASESRLRSLCDDNEPALSLLAPLECMSSYPLPRSKPSASACVISIYIFLILWMGINPAEVRRGGHHAECQAFVCDQAVCCRS